VFTALQTGRMPALEPLAHARLSSRGAVNRPIWCAMRTQQGGKTMTTLAGSAAVPGRGAISGAASGAARVSEWAMESVPVPASGSDPGSA